MNIKLIGVVGCGTMGSGIAQVCAQSGYQVIVSEVSQVLLDRGLKSINIVLTRGMEKGKITPQDRESALSRIHGTTDLNRFRDCNLIIEAVSENLNLKKNIFMELDKIAAEDAILGTNTSCLSVTDIAKATNRPGNVLGLHFFNPVPVMALMEIVQTIITTEDTINISRDFGKSLGKTVLVARDTPGFFANRLGIPNILNGIRMLENGIANREDIDNAMRLGFNHPMGPLALADLIGLDVVYSIANSIYEETKDPQCFPPVLLKKMMTVGWLGQKTGKGFYDYR